MKTVKFTKAVATGNDFIIIDNRRPSVMPRLPALAKDICSRKYSVGADGLVTLERSRVADFRMRIFNPDGGEAEMCGNGSRCIALFAATKHIAPKHMTIETAAGIINASVVKDIVNVKLTDPKDIKWDFCLTLNRCPYRVSFMNTGVPHVVYFIDDLDKVDVKKLGSEIRYHPRFSPEGANADFVKVLGSGRIKIRTYERGVEDETLACGTGAVASALISAEANRMPSPMVVETRGGEKLKVYFELEKGAFRDVYLEGKASLVFDGTIYRR